MTVRDLYRKLNHNGIPEIAGDDGNAAFTPDQLIWFGEQSIKNCCVSEEKGHFLTTFTFTTGENRHRDQRIVVAKNSDAAYEKAKAWFPENYPESELISIVFHEWIT